MICLYVLTKLGKASGVHSFVFDKVDGFNTRSHHLVVLW